MIFLLTRGSEMDNQQVRPLICKPFPLNSKYKVCTDGSIYGVRGNKLKGKDHQGYVRHGVYIDGKPKQLLAHRMIAITFLDNPLNLAEVNHIDGNRSNNNLDNLEWVSREGNQQHAFRTGLNSNKGSKNGKAELDENTARDLYLKMLDGATPKELSISEGIGKGILVKLRNKVTWVEITQDLPDCSRLTMEACKQTTDEQRITILQMKQEKIPTKVICETLGLTVGQVEHVITNFNKGKLQRLGVSRTPKRVEVVSSSNEDEDIVRPHAKV